MAFRDALRKAEECIEEDEYRFGAAHEMPADVAD
jgi:hypothetical protein